MPYIIPFVVNNRKVQYLYADVEPLEAGSFKEPFIVSMDAPGTTLFYFDRSMDAKIINDPEKGDITLNSSVVTFDTQSENILNIKIRKEVKKNVKTGNVTDADDPYPNWDSDDSDQGKNKPGGQQVIGIIGELTIYQKEDNGLLSVFVSNGRKPLSVPTQINCKILMEVGTVSYYSEFLLHITPPLQLLQGALDFGSEASQLLQQKKVSRGDRLVDQAEPIDILRHLLPPDKKEHPENFIQFEQGSTFFKSIFYIRKSIETTDLAQFHSDDSSDENFFFLPDENTNLLITVDKNKENEILHEFTQLPNLKLLRRHNALVGNVKITLRDNSGDTVDAESDVLLRKTYGSILKKIIVAWLQPEFIKNTAPRLVRLTLLMPNIYDEADVRQTLQTLHAIFNWIKKQEKYKNKLAGWEVQTVSESDAAFLGYYRKKSVRSSRSNGYYVIIDCGKGTTDFSIIKPGKTDSDPLLPIYRNGIAGAGNFLSYSVFQAILKYIADVNLDSDALANFVSKLLSSDSGFLRRIAAQVDQLKYTYDTGKSDRDISDIWNNVKGGNFTFSNLAEKGERAQLENLLAIVINQRIKQIPDDHKLVQKGCKILVDAIAGSIEQAVDALRSAKLECDGVFLTGRGFLFMPLRTMFIQDLASTLKIRADQIKLPEIGEYKSIALEGILNSPFLLQSQIIGWPVQVKHTETDLETKEEAPPSGIDNLFGKLGELVKVLRIKLPGRVSSLDALSMLNGDLNSHRLLIGNDLWWIKDPGFRNQMQGRKYDLVFNPSGVGSCFSIRRLNASGICEDSRELDDKMPANRGVEKLVKPSLFPLKFDEEEIALLIGDRVD